MPSLRALLDTFGQPPSQICLDWAWQIAAAEPDLGGPDLDQATDLLAGHDDWTTLEVADDGALQLAGLSRAMARRALEDLRTWMPPGDTDALVAIADRSAVTRALGRLAPSTAGAANGLVVDGAFAAINRLDEPSAAVTLPGQHNPRSQKLYSQKLHCKKTHGRKTYSRKTHSWLRSLWTKAFAWIANHRLRSCVALAAACVTGMLLLAWPSSGVSDRQLNKVSSVDRAAAGAVLSDPASGQDSVDLESNPPLAEDAPVASLTTSAELVGFEPDGSRKPQGSSPPALPLAALNIPGRLLTPKTAPSAAFRPDESAALASPTSAPASRPTERDDPAEPAAASIRPQSATSTVQDVMQQVAAVVAEAEAHSASGNDDNMPAQSADDSQPGALNDWLRQPPLAFSRDRMQLHVELPRGMRERLHDPRWQVLVAPTDGFVCEPADPQLLSPRTSGILRIYDEEAQTPRTCIILQLLNRGGRDAALEWRITGGAEDMSALRLPLRRKWLDPLRAQLRVSVASLRALTETPLPSASGELRTLLQNQRRLAGEQLKLGERLLTITAELDRLAALLDGELECHAQLREGPSGRMVLSYGTASAP